MWLVAGLGNPGAEYAATRHNIGFMTVDTLADGAHFSNKFQGEFALVTLGGEKVGLLKPQTYMNRSGGPVQAAMAFYKIAPEKLIVLHDELDLPLAKIRIKKGGGANGHNGLRDIDSAIGQNYWRIRLGIGHPGEKHAVHDYVLGRFSSTQRAEVDTLNKLLAEQFPLFWKHSPEALATKIAQTLNPPPPKKKPETDAPPPAKDSGE